MRESRRIPEQADFPVWKRKQLASYTELIDSQEEIWQLPNERTLRVVTQARRNGGLFVLYEDLTELLTLERSLNALSRVQLEPLNSLQEGVAVFGIDGRMRLYNPAFPRILKMNEMVVQEHPHIDEIQGFYQALVPDLRGWDAIKSRITGAETDREMYILRAQRKDNMVIDCTIAPLPDGGSLLTMADVTGSVQIERALRDRNEALETTDRLKSEFIAHISYQFRTRLNSIIGFAEILEHEFFGTMNERQHEYSQGLLEASQQLLALVNDVIDLASIESGQLSLSQDRVDVRGLLDSVRELSRQRARECDLTLVLDCPEDMGVIFADERRIKQVMFNLISNAIKFSTAGEEIVIGANRVVQDGGGVCQLWVRDRGAGIERNYQENMFKPFESRSRSGGEQGAGIGLSLVRSLIELHEGWVEIESEPGQGTKVICNLPLKRKDDNSDLPVSPPLAIQVIQARL
ncbi:MAG: PAS domain-containing sensor histidine kinase [Alphaproteobacteria bacterium]|nr:PAS domain-containing sensor histidine kinase [Alphaproteobacteria bacterium]